MKKQRLDLLLVELNLCDSRQLAQRWIQAGEVRVNGEVVDKAGTDILVTAEIEVKAFNFSRTALAQLNAHRLRFAVRIG